MEIQDIVILRGKLQSLCLSEHQFEYVNGCISEYLMGRFQEFAINELVAFREDNTKNDYICIIIDEALKEKYRKFTIRHLVITQDDKRNNKYICTIINEILKERMKIYLEPYSKKVDIYNLILDGALFLSPLVFIGSDDIDYRDNGVYLSIQMKDFERVESLLIEANCGMIKYNNTYPYIEGNTTSMSFPLDDSAPNSKCYIANRPNILIDETKAFVFGIGYLSRFDSAILRW